MATRAGKVLTRELDLYNEFWAIAREGQEIVIPTRERFYVIEHTPGYMPDDDDPPAFDTAHEAWIYLTEEVKRYLDHLDETGESYSVTSDPGFYWAQVDVEGRALGRIFSVDSSNCTGLE
jgi:hypothetical protein